MRILLVFLILISCSTAKFQDDAFINRVFSPCKKKYENGNFEVKDHKKKFCRHFCKKWKWLYPETVKNCKEWVLQELDYEENHDSFLTGRFILINMDKVIK